MPRFWLLFLLVLVLGSAVQLLGPPWLLALVAFGAALATARPGSRPFLAGFAAGFLSWVLPALWLGYRNGGLLAGRVAELLPLGGRAWALGLLTGVLGGLLAGLAAWAGGQLRVAALPQTKLGAAEGNPPARP